MLEQIVKFFEGTGYTNVTFEQLIMIFIACFLMYLAIVKQYEPLLLVPISFGMLLANIPIANLMGEGKLHYWIYQGVKLNIYPPLIFLGVGAMTDFGPLIANPRSLLLGAAAQFGIFTSFLGASLLGFNFKEAASIGIIGGADGPTAIFLSSQLAPHLLGAIAVSAYSYMALVPII
ncbi:MAG: sodium ion-translocating decarboxylase subunit beta, partial [Tepidanaerobacteraceae bacterium]